MLFPAFTSLIELIVLKSVEKVYLSGLWPSHIIWRCRLMPSSPRLFSTNREMRPVHEKTVRCGSWAKSCKAHESAPHCANDRTRFSPRNGEMWRLCRERCVYSLFAWCGAFWYVHSLSRERYMLWSWSGCLLLASLSRSSRHSSRSPVCDKERSL